MEWFSSSNENHGRQGKSSHLRKPAGMKCLRLNVALSWIDALFVMSKAAHVAQVAFPQAVRGRSRWLGSSDMRYATVHGHRFPLS